MNNTICTTVTSQPAFIRGLGSAIPGLGDKRIKGGNGGTLLNVSDILFYLNDQFGLHNPNSGKVVDREWARRNLGVETIACANVDNSRSIQEEIGEESLTNPIPEEAVSITEDELAFIAFDEALERANLKPKDIDVILRVSPTQGNVYFWENMRVWKRQYPDLKDTVQMQHHPIGCPGFLVELKLARQLLGSPDINNVAIVISNVGSPDADRDYLKLHSNGNIMMHWVNLTIFGDGASTCIVSNDTTNPLPGMVFDLVDVDYRTDNENWVSKRDEMATLVDVDNKGTNQASTRPVYSLNVDGPKLIKGAVDHWSQILTKRHDFSLAKTEHVAFHTPNPKVLKHLGEHYGITEKLSFLPNTVANLGPASCVTNLHNRLYGSGVTVQDGETILGFALGACLGQLDGVFLLKARQVNETSPVVASVAESGAVTTAPLAEAWAGWYGIWKQLHAAWSPSPSSRRPGRRNSGVQRIIISN